MHMISSLALVFVAINGALSQTLANPNSVPIATRDQWCLSQKTQCPYICTQLPTTDGSPATESNTCSPDDLSYSCVCSNGQQPNSSEYSQTIPYYICTENNNECVANCGGVSSCQSNCRTQNLCGAQDPKRVNTTSASASASATGAAASATSSGAVYNGFGASGSSGSAQTTKASSGTKTGAATRTLLHIGQVYGLAMVVVGFFAGFAVIL